MIHLYCRAVQADFYSDAVECRTLSPADRYRSPVAALRFFHLLPLQHLPCPEVSLKTFSILYIHLLFE